LINVKFAHRSARNSSIENFDFKVSKQAWTQEVTDPGIAHDFTVLQNYGNNYVSFPRVYDRNARLCSVVRTQRQEVYESRSRFAITFYRYPGLWAIRE
jgi:hypothetical protein